MVKQHAGGEKKSSLDQPVPKQIESQSGARMRCEEAKSNQHQPHVAYGGIGKKAFDMPLHKTHQRTQDGRDRSGNDKDFACPRFKRCKCTMEYRPVNTRNRIEAQLHHYSGEEYANRSWSHRMSIGQPEVERHNGSLYEKAASDQNECGHHQRVMVGAKRFSDLGHVQRASASIEQANAAERHEGADGIRNSEVERSLNGAALFSLVSAERYGGRAHQFEKDKQVENVAR